MVKRLVFFILVLVFGGVGVYAGRWLALSSLISFSVGLPQLEIGLMGLGALIGLVTGLLLAPRLIRVSLWLTSFIEQYLQKTPTQDLIMGSVGLIIGLIISNLLGSLLSYLGFIGKIIWVCSTILLAYLGLSLGVKKREEIVGFLSNLTKFGKDKPAKGESKNSHLKILDTSVIIDGRIADLCESGFIEGVLVVPVFVLEELRHIADSADLLKRNRGRRGLDILNKLRKDDTIKVQIYESNKGLEDIIEVDSKLVKLGQKMGAKIMTNDYNLNKVAELHGVKVLNINELANAVKPVVLPGEEMIVHVVKDGKESGQGIGYLDDGTMIVVDGGRKHMGQTINVVVTSVLQTAAGRMIFAKPRLGGRDVAQQLNEVNALG